MKLKTFFLGFLFFVGSLVAAFEFQPGQFYSSGPKDLKQIALTFDDGPGPHTEKFLKLLEQYDVKATFFMLGKEVKRRPTVARLVKEKGHEIASHSWNHQNYLKRYNQLKKETKDEKKARANVMYELSADLQKTQNVIEETTKESPIFLRMPHGIDRPWIKDVAKEIGFVLVNWTYGADWEKKSVEELSRSYIEAIRPGAILLFHDGGGNRKKSLKLVEAVIQYARHEGYHMSSVGDLLSKNFDERETYEQE